MQSFLFIESHQVTWHFLVILLVNAIGFRPFKHPFTMVHLFSIIVETFLKAKICKKYGVLNTYTIHVNTGVGTANHSKRNKKMIQFVFNYSLVYRGDLNIWLVRYLNGQNVPDRWMVWYLNTRPSICHLFTLQFLGE